MLPVLDSSRACTPSARAAQAPAALATLLEGSQHIDTALRELLKAHATAPRLDGAVRYALGIDELGSPRGRRIRPALCLLSCRSLGGDERGALPFAAAMEFVHGFSLVLDDIQDADPVRRGRPSLWVSHGLELALTVAGYLQSLATLAVLASPVEAELRLTLVQMLAETIARTGRGQTLDLDARRQRDFGPDEFVEVARLKSGEFLAAPIVAGALIAGADEQLQSRLWAFGRELGVAYQIRDDLLDTSASEGRPVGSDIRAGRRSWAMLELARVCSPAERELLHEVLDRPPDATDAKHIATIVSLLEDYEIARSGWSEVSARASACVQIAGSLPVELGASLSSFAEHVAAAPEARP